MKKKKQKEIRKQIEEGLNLILSAVDINKPSRKLKKFISLASKRLTDQIIRDLDKMIRKEEKELKVLARKIKTKAKEKVKKKKKIAA